MADASLPANDPVNQFNPYGNDTNVWKLLDRIEQIEQRLDEIEDRQRTPDMRKNDIVFGRGK